LAGEFHYGGQAIIEGVMIRGKTTVASAIRRPDGRIVVHTEPASSLVQAYRWLAVPFIRGTPALIDALRIGFRALIHSANVALEAEGVRPPSRFYYFLTFLGALALGVGLFVILPSVALSFGFAQDKQPLSKHSLTMNFLEGLLRILIFLAYVAVISRWGNVRRLFQYHGAEHMVINAFEAGREVSSEEAKGFATLHVRCGSSFIMLVLFIAILVHFLAGWPAWYVRVPLRLLLIVPIAGISYEIMKLAASPKASWLTAAVTAPGLWLQRLTTRPPDEDQIEVAVAALAAVLKAEAGELKAAARPEGVVSEAVGRCAGEPLQ